jgi:hypothetical protein
MGEDAVRRLRRRFRYGLNFEEPIEVLTAKTCAMALFGILCGICFGLVAIPFGAYLLHVFREAVR